MVDEPRQCRQCDALNCAQCLNEWYKTNGMILSKDKCPNCKERRGFQDVNRIVMTMLNNMEFKCTRCKNNFKYINRKEHYSNECESCKLRPICELCPKNTPSFESKDHIFAHWQLECQGIKVRCNQCELTFPRGFFPHHECIKELKEINKRS